MSFREDFATGYRGHVGGSRKARLVMKYLYPLHARTLARPIRRLFFADLVAHTDNFAQITWLGQPIWQNVLDLWTIQETIATLRPELLIECGTWRGGSALYYAQLLDLVGDGRVITIDVEKMHDLDHPRVEFLLGSSVSDDVLSRVRQAAAEATGPVMVILDDDHTPAHVENELEAYAPLVTPGSYILIQDGLLDRFPFRFFGEQGPLRGVKSFLRRHPEFEVDRSRTDRFLITNHPMGWLRRR